MVALCAVALIARRLRGTSVATSPLTQSKQSSAGRILFYLCFSLIILRLLNLGLEIYWRPLFPWDASMHWTTKARVWFEHQSMIPFVSHREWLNVGGEGVYTDVHPGYPTTVPLLQVWMNLALGRWDESLMNFPWLACLLGLGLFFYGQIRLAGASAAIAMAFTYLLMSMPLLNIHVALAGYADLFLAAAYCSALMSFHHWCHRRERWLAISTLLFLAMCPLIKNEGGIWAATLLPAVAIVLLPRSETNKLCLLMVLLAILFVLAVPNKMVVVGTTLNQLQPSFNLAGLKGTIISIWLLDNWHLLGYLLLAAVPIILFLRQRIVQDYLGILVALGAAISGFLFLFLFTGFAVSASNHDAVGRLCMQLIPALLFLTALLYTELVARQEAV